MLDDRKIEMILKACDDKKAYNFVVLDVSQISSITDCFIICSANNDKQAAAIGESVLDMAAKEGFDVLHKEGFDTARWILIEFDSVIVHIFQRDEREIYDLESLWTDNNSVDVEQYGIKNWK